MQFNKTANIILGILTFLPFLIVFGAILFAAYQILEIFFSEKPFMPIFLLSYLGYIIPYMFLYVLFYIGLGIFYLVHIIQNSSLDTEKKILWVVVLITLNGISMPFYWYVHLWNEKSPSNTDPVSTNVYEATRTEPNKL